VQSQVDNNLWQVDLDFKVQFLLPVRVLLYGFHQGYLSLNLVQTPSWIFVKRTIILISWNEINDCYSISSLLICDLVFFLLSPHLPFASVLFKKWYKNVILFCNNLLLKKSA
jgi:hypothetical protein